MHIRKVQYMQKVHVHTHNYDKSILTETYTAVNLCQYGAFKKQAINTVPAASIHM